MQSLLNMDFGGAGPAFGAFMPFLISPKSGASLSATSKRVSSAISAILSSAVSAFFIWIFAIPEPPRACTNVLLF
jgi:hypothetical protein